MFNALVSDSSVYGNYTPNKGGTGFTIVFLFRVESAKIFMPPEFSWCEYVVSLIEHPPIAC